jgi:hypothetical protein
MSGEEKLSVAETIAEALGGLLFFAVLIGLLVVLPIASQLESAKELTKDLAEPHSYLIGKVKSVETRQAEDYTEKQGNMTLTITIKDRTLITFQDGRSKEFLGVPKEPISTEKEVAIVFNKYNVILEIVDAEEYKKKHPQNQ